MLWPIVLPLKITLTILVTLVVIVTLVAPLLKWKRGQAFAISAILACIALIPSCLGVMAIVDAQRFGVFQYGVFSDVNDSRIERHLPTNARNITLEKRATGHRAKYSISESDLKEYLDGQWAQHGNRSSIPRAELREGAPVAREQFDLRYGDLGWLPLENAVEFHSPVASDGSGATYFFDARIGTAYHHAGYW